MKRVVVLLFSVLISGQMALAQSSATSSSKSRAKKAKSVDMKKDFESLGDNAAVIQKAKALDPQNEYKVVQSRIVDRHMRLELGLNYGLVGGGDSYVNTQNLGANMDFHITPYWSVGARYYHSYNSLNAEGNNAVQTASQVKASGNPNTSFTLPAIDYASDTTLGVISWYPIYGKLNMFDMGVTHFDVYLLGGYGVTTLASGPAGTTALGGGLGFWFTNWLAARLEGRWQNYTDHPNFDGPNAQSRNINEIVGMASIGILL